MPTFAIYQKQGYGRRFHTIADLDEIDRESGATPRGFDPGDYVHVADVDAADLEDAYGRCQSHAGSWFARPGVRLVDGVELPLRSLAVGDMVDVNGRAFEVDHVGFRPIRHPEPPAALFDALEAARAAFWSTIAAAFPDAAGDLDPGAVDDFHEAATRAARAWYEANVGTRGVA